MFLDDAPMGGGTPAEPTTPMPADDGGEEMNDDKKEEGMGGGAM